MAIISIPQSIGGVTIPGSVTNGPLGMLFGGKKGGSLQYPRDLGSTQKNHYVIFKIFWEMSNPSAPKNSVSTTKKLYLFPSLVTILAMMIWRDVNELRSDVKQLLAQSNVDKTEIQNLKKEVDQLNRQVFKTPIAVNFPVKNTPSLPNELSYNQVYFKDEEVFDITKYVPKS